MKRLLFFAVVVLGCLSLSAQGGKKIMYRADMGYYDEDFLPGAQRLIGNVKFAQGNAVGYCDSAYLYDAENYIIAFGNPVKIIVGDSVFLYGKTANFDGNARQASISQSVRLVNGNAYLVSDSLFYNLNTDCGYYNTGGTMYNGDDTLSSIIGRYYTRTDDAYLNGDVLLRSTDYKVYCDSLRYNAANKTAYFISPTRMVGDDNEIFTSSGYYNTETEKTTLSGQVSLVNKDQSLFADSIYYDKNLHFGRAWNNVTYVDTTNNFIVKGNYMEHYEKGGTSIVTDSNMLVVIDDNNDSLFLHSDTLLVDFDTTGNVTLMRAFNHTKFYHKDIQGACDSVSYVVSDSVLTMFYEPVLWTDTYQMTADTIRFTRVDSLNSVVELANSGFIIGGVFENTEFNQIKGLSITGYIVDKDLKTVDIDGNAECVYYLQEEDSTLVGVNSSITSRMHIMLDSNKIHQIRYYDAPDGQIYPDDQIDDKDRKLKGFVWLDEFRPYKIEDIFIKPVVRNRRSDEDGR